METVRYPSTYLHFYALSLRSNTVLCVFAALARVCVCKRETERSEERWAGARFWRALQRTSRSRTRSTHTHWIIVVILEGWLGRG